MEPTASFGYWLRRRRKALDLTQDALAQQAGCALGTLKKIETDQRRPSLQLAERLAICLAIPTTEQAAFIKAARTELAVDQIAVMTQPIKLKDAGTPPQDENIRSNNLPAQPTALIGREREIAEVCELLRGGDVRLLTLTGPGGSGKTRLALQVAAELPDAFPDGVWFVNLAPIRDPVLVATTIAHTLGIVEAAGKPIEASLRAFLGRRQLLLLLDNFEQVLEAAPLIADLLAAAPGLKILATSRATLHLYGEYEFSVPPLALPTTTDNYTADQSDVITQYESVRLFITRARAAKSDFTVTNDNAPAVAAICRRLDGLPLAIELAAARIKLFAPETLLARLSQPLALLVGGPRDLPPRQQTLRNTIEWSYALLDEGEQALFRRLGVFVGGCTLAAAEAVCENQETQRPGDTELIDPSVSRSPGSSASLSVLDGLAALVNQSLLRQEEGSHGEPRFIMLETVREYALERLSEQGELEKMQRHHADFFMRMAEQAEPELWGPWQVSWLQQLEIEHDNMRAVLEWDRRGEDTQDIGARLAAALGWFWLWRGYRQEGYLRLREAADAVTKPTLLRARILHALGVLILESDIQPSQALFEESLAISRELGDIQGQADALYSLGLLTQFLFESKLTINDFLKESLGLYQQIGHTLGIARVLGRGDRKQCEESLALQRSVGNLRGCADVLTNLGRIAHDQEDHVQAMCMLQEAIGLHSQLQDEGGVLWALLSMSDIHQATGDFARASALAEESAMLARKLNDHMALGYSLNNLGEILLCGNQFTRASPLFDESIPIFRELGDQFGLWQGLIGRARIAAAAGKAALAVQLCASVEAVSTTQDNAPANWPPEHRNHYNRTIAAIRAQLDDTTFAAEWAAGRALTLEQAIAEALNR